MNATDAAREVVGSLVDYKEGDGCPMCDAPVLQVDSSHCCTSCQWTTPYRFAIDWGLKGLYDKKMLDRLLPALTSQMFGSFEPDQEPKFGDTVKFRRFPFRERRSRSTDAN